ncbi:1,6-anhydro-N-acetylmuramyl-L-alanine amidase AmpD [Ectothiorhodospira mobilis]|uniref:1,6-anhydro-N-acetylmuramyl-L-alanine amidase AmpD n=1 Tax=Ectothiorhodospira mobilis TaxID=195064 RepID=UPI0019065480|nr:1,6-anhydro-N-acetylmuramyl-L-alanine amidase AmpD [Ectothiorhodospira mobilis]MBK1691624.1 N-acetylmuramoyl-L-alanine amidase [Ectothiorhodospira mobilis]
MLISPQGWLDAARHCPSPNRDLRPPGCLPELIVIHAMSLPPGEFGGPWIDRLFTNRLDPGGHPYFAEIQGLRVSAHLLVRRDGALVQYVPFHERAWHAGVSCYGGRTRCNDFSVGIELEGTDAHPFEPGQYTALAAVIRALRAGYTGLAAAPVVGHADIAPGRKTDPGPRFDWGYLRRLLATTGADD